MHLLGFTDIHPVMVRLYKEEGSGEHMLLLHVSSTLLSEEHKCFHA